MRAVDAMLVQTVLGVKTDRGTPVPRIPPSFLVCGNRGLGGLGGHRELCTCVQDLEVPYFESKAYW
jgi:hypothetical protein